jgi:catechol 2,3-dioxygenase-like lactoylglutathione lyase family enzyme
MFGDAKVAQIAVVVKDIESAKVAYAALFGKPVPPTIVTDPGNLVNMTYRGEPSNDAAKLAFIDLPNVQFELIEPIGERSAWYEGLARTSNGYHHMAYWVENMASAKAHLEQHGFELIQRGDMGEGQYAYFDSPSLGIVLELLESKRTQI